MCFHLRRKAGAWRRGPLGKRECARACVRVWVRGSGPACSAGEKAQRRAFQPSSNSRWPAKAAPETGLPEWSSGPCIIAHRLPSPPSPRCAPEPAPPRPEGLRTRARRGGRGVRRVGVGGRHRVCKMRRNGERRSGSTSEAGRHGEDGHFAAH